MTDGPRRFDQVIRGAPRLGGRCCPRSPTEDPGRTGVVFGACLQPLRKYLKNTLVTSTTDGGFHSGVPLKIVGWLMEIPSSNGRFRATPIVRNLHIESWKKREGVDMIYDNNMLI